MDEEVARDQVAATLAAAIIISRNVPCVASEAIMQMREVRAALYPPPSAADLLENPAFRAYVAKTLTEIASGEYKVPDDPKDASW